MTYDNHRSFAQRKGVLAVALCLIGAVAVHNRVVSPHIGYLHAMQRLEPVLDRMAEELEAVDETREEKLSTARGLQAELARVREGLFTPEEAAAFTHDLPTLIENTGCTMSEVDLTSTGDSEQTDDPHATVAVRALNVDCTVMGQYEQIVALLQSLHQRRQKVWVDSCEIDLLDPRGGRLKCRLGLTIFIMLQLGGLHG